nr:HAMP domain-containing methyl-accepting chemotaxis protein [Brevibacillus fulvus]
MLQHGKSSLTINLLAAGIVVLIAVAVSWYLSKQLTNPILAVIRHVERVASGDLQVEELQVRSKDEVGKLVQTVNQMAANLRLLMAGIVNSADYVAGSSQELTASAEETARAAEVATQAIQEVSSGAERTVMRAQESARAVDEVALGIQRIAETSALVATLSESSLKEAEEGNQSIQNITKQMYSIHHQVTESAALVKALEEHSQSIEQIVSVITGIASQTNLLALNAAIEAARAGEHGKGFAVVAEEVRKLAEQSEESARQIKDIIHEIQVQTEQAVGSMEKGTSEVQSGLRLVDGTGEKFQKIVTSAHAVALQVNEISFAAEQMSASSQQIAASMEEMIAIAAESTDDIKSVSATADEQLAIMEEITSSAESLSRIAQQMRESVGVFKV